MDTSFARNGNHEIIEGAAARPPMVYTARCSWLALRQEVKNYRFVDGSNKMERPAQSQARIPVWDVKIGL
jgi:hypothetical protein